MEEALLAWHDFNVALVTAAAALLGLLFVALSIHIRSLIQPRNAELRSVARTVFLGYVVALAIGFLALWFYGSRRLLREDSDRREVMGITRSYIPGVPVYVAGTLLAFASPIASLIVFAGLACFYVLSSSMFARDS